MWKNLQMSRKTYRKIPKYSDIRTMDVIILKFETYGSTIE